jgi:hypothetical protein
MSACLKTNIGKLVTLNIPNRASQGRPLQSSSAHAGQGWHRDLLKVRLGEDSAIVQTVECSRRAAENNLAGGSSMLTFEPIFGKMGTELGMKRHQTGAVRTIL